MALILLDRVKETTIVVGTTASVILLGATPGYQSFAGVGNANTTYYCIADQSGGLNWEVGLGTYTLATTTITRAATPLSSSNAGASVNFSAGTKDIFSVYPSSKGIWLDGSGNAVGLGTPAAFVATNVTGLPLTTGITGTLPVANGGTGVTASTGSGNNVLSTSPTLVSPALGTPTSGTLTNCTFPTLNQNTTGNAATVTNGIYTTTIDSYAVKRSNNASNINFNSYTSNSQVVGFDAANTNGPSGVTSSTMLVMQERGDTSSQFVIDYNTGHAFSRGIYLTAPTYSPWRTILDDGNYNSYAPSLTGSGASGTWGISVTGSSSSCTGNAATATALSTASGSAPSYSARAWVNFNGTGTVAIRASGNVSSITDNGVGDYTVNFTTAMPDANYSINATGQPPNDLTASPLAYISSLTNPSTTLCRIRTVNPSVAFIDNPIVCVSIFR